jgi:hypothetical protein
MHLLRMRQQLAKLDLLVLEELGYVPASKTGAELLFVVIATAYERNSLIVTTNLPFENWTEVLGSERLTGAALDRLTHRCHIWRRRARRRSPPPTATILDRPAPSFSTAVNTSVSCSFLRLLVDSNRPHKGHSPSIIRPCPTQLT